MTTKLDFELRINTNTQILAPGDRTSGLFPPPPLLTTFIVQMPVLHSIISTSCAFLLNIMKNFQHSNVFFCVHSHSCYKLPLQDSAEGNVWLHYFESQSPARLHRSVPVSRSLHFFSHQWIISRVTDDGHAGVIFGRCSQQSYATCRREQTQGFCVSVTITKPPQN